MLSSILYVVFFFYYLFFFFQAEDGIRYLVRSRGLGDVYKRQSPRFGYSIGLYKEFNHPELIIIGLDPESTGSIINLSLIHI